MPASLAGEAALNKTPRRVCAALAGDRVAPVAATGLAA
jgi:hypothetical protein